MADGMFLFWGSGSTPCMRVMMVLEEKGFSGYQHRQISFEKRENKCEEILKLNPRGQVIMILTNVYSFYVFFYECVTCIPFFLKTSF